MFSIDNIDAAKKAANRLRKRLAQDTIKITHALSLEAISAIMCHRNWNVTSAELSKTITEELAEYRSRIDNSQKDYLRQGDFNTLAGKRWSTLEVLNIGLNEDQTLAMYKLYKRLLESDNQLRITIPIARRIAGSVAPFVIIENTDKIVSMIVNSQERYTCVMSTLDNKSCMDVEAQALADTADEIMKEIIAI